MNFTEIISIIQTGVGVVSLIVSLITLKTVGKMNKSKQFAIGKNIEQRNNQSGE